MDAALKKSVVTLNSQLRDYTTDPNSCDFITVPGFLTGQHGNTSYTDQSGQPLFYGVDQVALLDATYTEHANNSPISVISGAFNATIDVILTAGVTTNFPESGLLYVEETQEQIWYNSRDDTAIPPVGSFDNCIRGFNDTPAAPVAVSTTLHLMGEPYIYIRLTEPSIGPLEAVEMTATDPGIPHHYNRFFAKIPIDPSKVNIRQYFNHDGKWSTWSNWINFSQPFPYIERLRMETFRFYGKQLLPYPNPNSPLTRSLPLNITLRIEAHENKMWENRGIIVDASEDETESSGEEEGFY